MKKIVSLVLVVVMLATLALCFSSCSKKGKFVVGITDFKPMDYEKDGKWVGFDADVASLFAESLGLEVEFVEIEWDNKIISINAGEIDCVWNGMTLTSEVTSSMDCSNAYCLNKQVVVMKESKAAEYTTVESLKSLKIAAEAGSAGEEALADVGITATAVDTQSKALLEVAAGTSDACVIDLLMAGAMIGAGTSYPDLVMTLDLTEEEYGVAFKKGSEYTAKLNAFFKEKWADGTLTNIGKTYGVAQNLIPQG